MNQQIQPYQQIQSQAVQAQWVELIVPVLVGIMLLAFIAGMVRDLFKGAEVKLPL
jgi:TRAP-type C4-dicarboxylate transport system permease small subunit